MPQPTAKIWVVDDEPSDRFPIYTRGNVGEVFPTVVTPLTWSLYGREAEIGWREAYGDVGLAVPGDFAEAIDKVIVGVFGGYCYLNLSYIRLLGVRMPGLTVEQLDQQLFGENEAPPYVAQPGDKSPVATARMVRHTLKTVRTKALPELEADKADVRAWLAALPDIASASTVTLLDVVVGFRAMFRRLFRRHIAITSDATTASGLLSQLVAGAPLHDPTLANKLVAGLGDVESAAPSTALWDLGRLVAGDVGLTASFANGLDGLSERLAADGSPSVLTFRERFDAFVREFGSRGPNEWEAASPTWETEPRLALAAIDRMRLTAEDRAPNAQHARVAHERAIATASARQQLRAPQRKLFDTALRAAQVLSQGRERSKTTIIRAIHGVRMVERELARRGRAMGGAENLTDFWLLTIDEVPKYLEAPGEFLDVIAQRRALRDQLAVRVPPFVFTGSVPPIDTWARRDVTTSAVTRGTELRGIAGCPGVARGRARVVLDPLDPRGLEPGDVLVAPITDPAWTPLFVPASAVIVDVGAQLSHAVIVARELGIPAVVSVTGATATIPDGALVEVDGDRGVVRILALDGS